MGADLKRKEARKRKFESQNSESSFDAGIKMDLEDSQASESPKKKSKQMPPSPSPSEEIPTAEKSAAGKVAVVDESTDQAKEENPAKRKAQRFIVFIGPSNLFKYAWLSDLTVLFLHQAIYPTLQRMSQ